MKVDLRIQGCQKYPMATIKTNENVDVIMDDEDLHLLPTGTISSARKIPVFWKDGKLHNLARAIMKAPKGMVVDHIDGNTLNNSKSNLRICSQSENSKNQKKRTNKTSSSFKGVTYRPEKKHPHWSSHIKVNYEYKHLGCWKTEREAAIAYNISATEHFGKFARLNKIEGLTQSEIDSVIKKIHNPKKRSGNSKYRGVCFYPDRNKYMAYLNHNGKRHCLGRFSLEIEAAKAVNAFISQNNLNVPLNII